MPNSVYSTISTRSLLKITRTTLLCLSMMFPMMVAIKSTENILISTMSTKIFTRIDKILYEELLLRISTLPHITTAVTIQ